jgi:hypothetical protein
MIELLGKIPKKLIAAGKNAKDYFNKKGELKYIRNLQPWGLEDVFMTKYKWCKEDAKAITEFILPMLAYNSEQRATAQQMLKHPWLKDIYPIIDPDTL